MPKQTAKLKMVNAIVTRTVPSVGRRRDGLGWSSVRRTALKRLGTANGDGTAALLRARGTASVSVKGGWEE